MLQDDHLHPWPKAACRAAGSAPAGLAEGRAAARLRLAERDAPDSLFARISIKWHTWSSARDCRGFRARDDLHRRSATLLELACEPAHELWGVLARGRGGEVRGMKVVLD